MRGITSWGAYLPHWRLDRSTIAAVAGQGGGRGTRTVASFDQDTTTLAVEAARVATGRSPGFGQVLFATTAPAYADKTNATTIHAALGLPASVAAWDLGASARSAAGAVALAARSPLVSLVVAADIRSGRAGSADESAGGDGAAAVVIADDSEAPVAAEFLAAASATVEAVDRWRAPGDQVSRTWDERFAEVVYRPAVTAALGEALAAAGMVADDVDVAVVAGPTARVGAAMAKGLGVARVADDLSATVGNTGAAHALVCLAAELERLAGDPATAGGGTVVALVAVGDGCDVTLWRTTPALAGAVPASTVASQAAAGAPVTYGRYLAWRGLLDVEPPRRPEPARVSAPAAWRSSAWKFAFTASRDTETGRIHLPPSRVSADGERTDAMEPVALSSAQGTVATFTVDRVAYSPSPPIIFAVVDFDGGGRFPVELCDLSPDEVAIGSRVALTFRRLHAADDIPNYFWKARLVRPDGPTDAEDAR
jgi:hydroxymethylglutaryl-CoA synthase